MLAFRCVAYFTLSTSWREASRSGGCMSKMAAIEVAIRLQLASDGKIIAFDRRMNNLQRPADDPNNPPVAAPYDESTMKTFLLNVANRLKLDAPPLTFAWRSLDVNECLRAELPMLVNLIETATNDPA